MSKLTAEQIEILRKVRSASNKINRFPTIDELPEYGITRPIIRRLFQNKTNLEAAFKEMFPKEYAQYTSYRYEDKRKDAISQTLAEAVVELGRYPTLAELSQLFGISTGMIENHFGNLSQALKHVESSYDLESSLFSSKSFTKEQLNSNKKEIAKNSKFFFTNVGSGCKVDVNALNALYSASHELSAIPVFLPSSDPARKGSMASNTLFFDTVLRDEVFAFDDIQLNERVTIAAVMTSMKQINPLTGLKSTADNKGLTIVASPKQDLEPLPNMKEYPGYLLSSGSITVPDYSTDRYMSNRTAYIAKKQHKMGAVAVTIENKKRYKFSNIIFNADGSFFHRGKKYLPSGKIEVARPLATILPDLHLGEAPKVCDFLLEEILQLKPRKLVLHDTVDGEMANPHHKKYHLEKLARKFKTITEELDYFAEFMKRLSGIPFVEEIALVASNHPDFFRRYIEDGQHAKLSHKEDYIKMHELAILVAKNSGKEKSMEHLLAELVGLEGSKFKFLREQDSYLIDGVECGQHGHRAAQGKRNMNLVTAHQQLGASVTGHGHMAGIYKDAFRVGAIFDETSHGYAKGGPSGWGVAAVNIYEGGICELIHTLI